MACWRRKGNAAALAAAPHAPAPAPRLQELSRRCETLIRLIEKENEDDEERVGALCVFVDGGRAPCVFVERGKVLLTWRKDAKMHWRGDAR